MVKDNKKPVVDSSEQELEKRIDEMLDPARPDNKPIKPAFEVLPNEDVEVDEPKTAPEVDNKEFELVKNDADKVDEKEVINNNQEESSGEDIQEEFGADPETEKAVDEIVEKESNELLAVEDEKIAKAFDDKKPNLKQKIKNFFINWWNNKRARWITIIASVLIIVTAFVIPTSRYALLNLVGVRSSASVIVLDDSTQQPLKNVSVTIRGKTSLTDENGKAVLYGLKLGKTKLVIEKRAFAKDNRDITLGWGSNPLGDVKLTPVGTQYLFFITDFLSNKPIAKAEAISGEFSAFSDEEGKIKLTIDDTTDETFDVVIKAQDQREETVNVSSSDKEEREIKMVPWRKHVFISKRSGKYDLYKIDADGNNEELVLAGAGVERDDIVIVPHPIEEKVALVSTRENVRNQDGYLLSTLTILDLKDNEPKKVAQSERIQVIDWIGNNLIYVKISAGTSAANPNRHKIVSYNADTDESKDLASSNYFNDVFVNSGRIYYAPSSAYATETAGLFRINADGTDKKTVLSKEVWSMIRTDYNKLVLSTGDSWYDLNLDNDYTTKLSGEPPILSSKIYSDNPSKNKSLWIDQRDGKGVLIVYDIEKKADGDPLYSQSGLRSPIRWLNDKTIVYRISTDQETADYVISVGGGDPRKIKNVTNTASIEEWYYY